MLPTKWTIGCLGITCRHIKLPPRQLRRSQLSRPSIEEMIKRLCPGGTAPGHFTNWRGAAKFPGENHIGKRLANPRRDFSLRQFIPAKDSLRLDSQAQTRKSHRYRLERHKSPVLGREGSQPFGEQRRRA